MVWELAASEARSDLSHADGTSQRAKEGGLAVTGAAHLSNRPWCTAKCG